MNLVAAEVESKSTTFLSGAAGGCNGKCVRACCIVLDHKGREGHKELIQFTFVSFASFVVKMDLPRSYTVVVTNPNYQPVISFPVSALILI